MIIRAFLIQWFIAFVLISVGAFVIETWNPSFQPNYLLFLFGTGVIGVILQTLIGWK
jgi:hypothetical protein